MTRLEPPRVPEAKVFMTYIDVRSPKWKPHTTIGHAKNAIVDKVSKNGWGGYARKESMLLYKFIDNDWVLLYEIPVGMKYAELPWNNTPELLEKEAKEKRHHTLRQLESKLVQRRDSAKLREVWAADASKELEGQFTFDIGSVLLLR